MLLRKPFNYTVSLRKLIQDEISFKFKVNEDIRVYSKIPAGASVTFDDLICFIKLNYQNKRNFIPDNQLYLKHVVNYWKVHPAGSHQECVDLWNQKPIEEKKFSLLAVKNKI